VGLFSDERPVRKVSPDAEFDEPTSTGLTELISLHSDVPFKPTGWRYQA
jgi:hypothetical protein